MEVHVVVRMVFHVLISPLNGLQVHRRSLYKGQRSLSLGTQKFSEAHTLGLTKGRMVAKVLMRFLYFSDDSDPPKMWISEIADC